MYMYVYIYVRMYAYAQGAAGHSVCCELAQTGLTTAGAAQLLSAGAASAKPDRRTERELSDLLTLQA